MNLLFNSRPIADQIVLGKICFDILSQEMPFKPLNSEFCGIWIDGRDRNINNIEDLASISSFYLYSQYFYPLLLFCYNDSNLLEGIDINKYPIKVIKIKELNSHKSYSDFCKNELPFLIPAKYEKLLFLQSDAFLIKKGWEDYINNINCNYLGSPWLHTPMIEFKFGDVWYENNAIQYLNVGNGAFSYRTLSNLKNISNIYKNQILREKGTEDKEPSEDLFFSCLTQLYGKLGTKEQALHFAADPLTLDTYNNKSVFGGHFPVYKDSFKEKLLAAGFKL